MSVSLPSFLSPSRCVLMIMDDGVGMHLLSGGKVEFLSTLQWREAGFEEKLADVVSRSGATSVVILNDAVEQHYRKERVPVITMLDRANIVQRRLNVAFPNFSMRAAKVLKQAAKGFRKSSGAKDGDAAKGDLYLFAAVPSTDGFGRIMMALSHVDVQIVGYGLLPVESTSLVTSLVKKLAQKSFGVGSARWSILLSQHRGGGLRQIVVKDNELALTRVTPVTEPDPSSPGAWAADVSQELQATLSYLSRFGYTPEDGLDIIAVGDKTYTEPLESMIYAPCNFTVLSVDEAMGFLGFKLSKGGDSHFAEAIHVGWVAKKMALELAINSRDIMAIKQPRMVAQVVMILCALGVGGVSGVTVDEVMKMYRASVNMEVALKEKKDIEEIYQEELLRKQRMGIDIPLVKGSLVISEQIRKETVDPLTLFDAISRELDSVRLDKFEFSGAGPEPAATQTSGQQLEPRKTLVTLYLSFAGSTKPKEGNEEIDKLVSRLNSRLKDMGYEAVVTKQLQDLSFEGVAESEAGITASKRASQDRYQGQVEVRKVVGQNG